MLLAFFLAAQPIAASGAWAAFDRGGTCEALSRSLLQPRRGEPQPRIAIAFDRAGSRRGEIHVALRRPVRAGSSVVMTIGDQPFLLAARGNDAWSRGPRQEAAMLAAMRAAGGIRVEARDTAGRRTIDRYLLAGAPTAIDAAAAACLRPSSRP